MKTFFVNRAELELGDGDVKLIQLEEGDIVLTKSEREALAKELISHYVSYSHQEAREVVRKICYLVGIQEEN
jgi:hypothetical protein